MQSGVVIETIRSVVASSTPWYLRHWRDAHRAIRDHQSLIGRIDPRECHGGFALAYVTGSVLLGFMLAMLVGALIALLVASSSIYLNQDQVAIGLVLTLLMTEVSSFVGRPFVRVPGPSVPSWSLPVLSGFRS